MKSCFLVCWLTILSFSDGTCRTVSHGKREHIPGTGYRSILQVSEYWNLLNYSELGAGIPGKPCVFPFKVNDIEFNECTSYQSPNGWPRCATEESQNLIRYKGSWGFCGEECTVEGTIIKLIQNIVQNVYN